MVETSRHNAPVALPNDVEHRRIIATILNQALLGRLNNTGAVTLETGAATTTVSDKRVSAQSVILLSPVHANAAAEVASGNLYISDVTAEEFTITHTNSATADRDFAYAFFG